MNLTVARLPPGPSVERGREAQRSSCSNLPQGWCVERRNGMDSPAGSGHDTWRVHVRTEPRCSRSRQQPSILRDRHRDQWRDRGNHSSCASDPKGGGGLDSSAHFGVTRLAVTGRRRVSSPSHCFAATASRTVSADRGRRRRSPRRSGIGRIMITVSRVEAVRKGIGS